MNFKKTAARIWAIVPAAGHGERFAAISSGAPPKQYATLLGATVLEWSLQALLGEHRLHAVVLALAPDDAHWPQVACRLNDSRLRTTVGGADRQDSVMNALDSLASEAAPDDWVLVHDAARPCLAAADLSALLDAVQPGGLGCTAGAVLAAPVVDTVKRASSEGLITVDRQGLWRALTPQVFPFQALRRALNAAKGAAISVTDEAQAMERMGWSPHLAAGSPFNIKVTRADDMAMAERILNMNAGSSMRVGQGFDVHTFGSGEHVMLGGVRIGHSHGVVAHSDGDVVIHALCDALLGALGDGDIGQHFPDSDPRYRGADSRIFLRATAERMRAARFRLVNADITVLAEAPRIGTHRAAMAANLGADLGVAAQLINVKATTTERLGFIGRGEGLAAMASVLLSQ